MFSIEYFDRTRRLFITLRGFWTAKDVDLFGVAMSDALAQRKQAGGPFDIMIDLSQTQTMGQDAALRMATVQDQISKSDANRIAFICQSAVSRLQVRRFLDDGLRFNIFEAPVDAEGWFMD